jgi:hypothetical protein
LFISPYDFSKQSAAQVGFNHLMPAVLILNHKKVVDQLQVMLFIKGFDEPKLKLNL